MSVLVYKKKVKFDSFLVEGCDTYSKDIDETSAPIEIDANTYYGASVYMCKSCIDKYKMHYEAEIPETDAIQSDDDMCSFACCVKGCSNLRAIETWLDISDIKLKGE